MIQFPETAVSEWEIVAKAANVGRELRQQLARDTRIESELDNLRIRYKAKEMFQQELAAGETPALEMGTLTDYKNTPSAMPSDLIEGAVKENGLTIMLGASGSGKTSLALQVIHSLATGDDWIGQPSQKLDGGFGIMSYDMDASGIMDWMSGFPGIDTDKVSIVNAHNRGNPLAVPAYRAQIVKVWRAMNVQVVIVDSFSASFHGQSQNDATETQAHYRDLLKFAMTEVGAKAVVVIVHSTKASPSKARGSTVQQDVADSIIGIEVDETTKQRTVSMLKYRAAMGKTEMAPVIITAPDSVTHLMEADLGAMSMAGMALPATVAGSHFFPATHEDPDTDTSEEDEEYNDEG